jgi:hypothetical protein
MSNHRVGRHYDNPPNASPGKASNGRRFRDHSHCDGSPSGRTLKRLRGGQTGIPLPLSPCNWMRKMRTSTHPAAKSMHCQKSGPKT